MKQGKKIINTFLIGTGIVILLLLGLAGIVLWKNGRVNKHGLAVQYFAVQPNDEKLRFQKPMAEGIANAIYTDNLEYVLESHTGQKDYAGIRWRGKITVPETGKYKFAINTNSCVRLKIGGITWIDRWKDENEENEENRLVSRSLYLIKGYAYDFLLDFCVEEEKEKLVLQWRNNKNQTRYCKIPESSFYLSDTYSSLYLSEIENETEHDMSDIYLSVHGNGFRKETEWEIVNTDGSSLKEILRPEVIEQSKKQTLLKVPVLQEGAYKIKASQGICTVISRNTFWIQDKEKSVIREEYPRPDWKRDDYKNLNGEWKFAFDVDGSGETEKWYYQDKKFLQSIQVPFGWESSLSGIEEPDYQGEAWYQKKVLIEDDWKEKNVFLKFGAVDWKCRLWINGQMVGEHSGGYDAFEFEITDYLQFGEENTITLWVEDLSSFGYSFYPALIGKQGHDAPCGYTHTSGIWQSVGLEARNKTYLKQAKPIADQKKSLVQYEVELYSEKKQDLKITYHFESRLYDLEREEDIPTGSVINGEVKMSATEGINQMPMDFGMIKNVKIWDCETPNLYYGTLTLMDEENHVLDMIETYFGIRNVETQYLEDGADVKYIYINGQPTYMAGLLDQGFWKEGIYTAPSEEALKFDILNMKERGFNMIRKHIKIEDPLQYYWCDKLGMYVWQDIPSGAALFPEREGGTALGREYYEDCLDYVLDMSYHHPSIIELSLFNETWGIKEVYNDEKRVYKAADGLSTAEWVEKLYLNAKERNPNMLVEDMSALNEDHVQPTDINSYHMYPENYEKAKEVIQRYCEAAYVGSETNFKFGNVQDGDPLVNSEYGGVKARSGDFDVSYCFKYLTDLQRQEEKQCGLIYTEPYDIEYERNGILTYDRMEKIFGYNEIAYGGDMTMKDLLQEIYVGISGEPVQKVKSGNKWDVKINAIAWKNKLPEKIVLKWILEIYDTLGNCSYVSEIQSEEIQLEPYRKNELEIEVNIPKQAGVGTLTVWLEDEKEKKLAKNFTNIVIDFEELKNTEKIWNYGDGILVMTAPVPEDTMCSTVDVGEQVYTYEIPEEFGQETWKELEIVVEASSCKLQEGINTYDSRYVSAYSQTAVGREKPTDVTIYVNDIEIDTITLPDNPRDMRGVLSLLKANNEGTSAGDFGYLVNIPVTGEKLEMVKETMRTGAYEEISVCYRIKEESENKNGLRIYSSEYGRYAVGPTIIFRK